MVLETLCPILLASDDASTIAFTNGISAIVSRCVDLCESGEFISMTKFVK